MLQLIMTHTSHGKVREKENVTKSNGNLIWVTFLSQSKCCKFNIDLNFCCCFNVKLPPLKEKQVSKNRDKFVEKSWKSKGKWQGKVKALSLYICLKLQVLPMLRVRCLMMEFGCKSRKVSITGTVSITGHLPLFLKARCSLNKQHQCCEMAKFFVSKVRDLTF